jgi:hypothetical protein
MTLEEFKRRFDSATLQDYFELLLNGEDCVLEAVGEERYRSLHASAAVIGIEQARQKRAEQPSVTEDASAARLAAEQALSFLKKRIHGIERRTPSGLGENAIMAASDVAEMDIFISHSSKDEEIVKRLITLIRSALNLPSESIRCTSVDGYRLRAGASVAEHLRRETHTAKVFIAVITPRSINSKYVLFELGARWGSGKPMIPVLAGGADAKLLEGPLSAINALSCDSPAQLHQLIEDVAVLIRKPDRVAAYEKCITELIAENSMAPTSARRSSRRE